MTGFVVGMGFEIADIHDADLLSRDIFERLIRIGMFADDVVSDQVRKIWALTAVDGFLRTGSLYGKALKVKLDTVDSHYLKVYEDFFKKLE